MLRLILAPLVALFAIVLLFHFVINYALVGRS